MLDETPTVPTTTPLPRDFWILWGGNVINRAGGFVNFVLAYYVSSGLGQSSAFTGLVLGVLGGAAGLGAVLGGNACDRYGRKPVLLTAQLGTAALMIALAFADQRWSLLLAAGALGTFQGMARPAFGALMVDVLPVEARTRGYNLQYWGNNAAAALAATVGGLVATGDYHLAFYVDAATTVVAAVFLAAFVTETYVPQPASSPTDAEFPAVSPWRDTVYLNWCILTFLLTLVFAQHISTLPLTMEEAGLSPAVFGALITINTVMIVGGQFLIPQLVEGRDNSKVMAVGSLIAGIGFGITGFADAIWAFGLSIVIWTFAEMIQSPAAGTLTAGLCPPSAVGRYQGTMSLFISLSMLVAPTVGGLVLTYLGQNVLWLGCFAVGLLSGALHWAQAGRRNARVDALAPTA